jgi:hypothetical protein
VDRVPVGVADSDRNIYSPARSYEPQYHSSVAVSD